jgi:hypothetical protein
MHARVLDDARYATLPITAISREAMARGTMLSGLRHAALELWGDVGLRRIGAVLPADVRQETVDSWVVAVGWYPERYVTAWFAAAFDIGAEGNEERFQAFVDRMMDESFVRVRRSLLRIAAPQLLASKAAELWRHDHSHGEIVTTSVAGGVDLVLREHVYASDPTSRMALAEIYRYVAVLSGARGTVATHELDRDGALLVHLRFKN